MILFSTGFVAMAMEVVWTRAFTPVLKTQVYSFAMIVFTYLGATFFGSWMYRVDLRKNRLHAAWKIDRRAGSHGFFAGAGQRFAVCRGAILAADH